MNNINRGVLIGVCIVLEGISDTLMAMSTYESDKECGTYCNVPTSHQGEYSYQIEEAVQAIGEAIKAITRIVPEAADFE